jgi:hypothetical protein
MALAMIQKIVFNRYLKYQKIYFFTWLNQTHRSYLNKKLLLINSTPTTELLDCHQHIITNWFNNAGQILTLYLMNLYNIYSMIITTLIDHPLFYLIFKYLIDYYLYIYIRYHYLTHFFEKQQIHFNIMDKNKLGKTFVLDYNKIYKKLETLYEKQKVLYIIKNG